MKSLFPSARPAAIAGTLIRRTGGMIRRLALFLLPVLALSACRKEHEWHQKLTVAAETSTGVVYGSSVVEVRAAFGRQVMSQAEVHYGYTGEATVVEVAPGKYLFALLGGTEERFACAVGRAMKWSGPWSPGPGAKRRGEWLAKIPRMAGQPPTAVPQECLPLMVTFGDITDPKSVQRVDPADLAASFGPGVRLKAVTLAVTEEPVTEGRVEGVVGWWLEMRSGPYNEMTALKLPDQSPRGWDHLGALAFWSLDRVQEFDRKNR